MLYILQPIRLVMLTAAICFAGLLATFRVEAAVNEAAGKQAVSALPAKLDNATCLACHDASKGELKTVDAAGNPRLLLGFDSNKFRKGLHGEMQCTTCHKDITDAVSPHKKGPGQKASCVSCHMELWEVAKKENLTKEKARLGVVVANIEYYKNSSHARPNQDDPTRPNAVCDECHHSHTFNVPPSGTSRRMDWHLSIPNVCGEKCHSDQLEEYATSVHGKEVLENRNLKAADCADCHTSHGITATLKDAFKLSVTENCGGCHGKNLKSYRDTYHGQVNKLGYGHTAKCYDCHGSHGVLRPNDPKSTVHPDNRLKTCQKCHKEATQGFVTFQPHANPNDFERYPRCWLVSRFMWALLAFVFTFFWLHTGLWWYREAKDSRARKNRQER